MRLYAEWVALAVLAGFGSALTISRNTLETMTIDKSAEDLTIKPNVYYWLLNNEDTVLGGSINNAGGFFVTGVNGASSNFTTKGADLINSGNFELNTLEARDVSIYNISMTNAFENTGDVYFGVSGSPTTTTPFIVNAGVSWFNSGTMKFESGSGPAARMLLGQEIGAGDLSYITNDGAICLQNADWVQTTNIVGKGCVTVGKGSKLQLQVTLDKLSFHFLPSQTIHLEAATSKLSFLGLTQTFLATHPTFKIAGFGSDNVIKIHRIFKGYFYDPETGLLKLKFIGPYSLAFDIGKEYAASKFSKHIDLDGSWITYSGAPPNAVPPVCSCERSASDVTRMAV